MVGGGGDGDGGVIKRFDCWFPPRISDALQAHNGNGDVSTCE